MKSLHRFFTTDHQTVSETCQLNLWDATDFKIYQFCCQICNCVVSEEIRCRELQSGLKSSELILLSLFKHDDFVNAVFAFPCSLRVRGQHTKTTGRRGRTVGVSKKK